jgi:hypothetical protein
MAAALNRDRGIAALGSYSHPDLGVTAAQLTIPVLIDPNVHLREGKVTILTQASVIKSTST